MAKKSSMAGFADKKELRRHQLREEAFTLGKIHSDHGVNFEAGISDDRHLFMTAGSRAGKGTTLIIPNLISWEGGVFCIDPKGENASITAMRRGTEVAAKGTGTSVSEFLDQQVAILDPYGIVRGPARKYRVLYDPLLDIEKGTDEEAAQIQAIAESVVISESGSGEHFTEGVQIILAGLIEAVIHTEKSRDNHTLTFCREKILKGFGILAQYLKAAKETDARLAQEAFAVIIDAGEDEAGSFSTTMSRQLRWMADPRIGRHLSDGGFSLTRALRENWSVYVCVPPSRIPRMKRWLRMIVRTALDAKMNSPFAHQGQQNLFLLDEFFALGHMQLIEDAAAYMAGYGIKLVPVIQNIGQIKKLYEKNWETFLGNAGAIIAWGLNDLETEKYISDRIGPVMGWERSYGESRTRDAETLTAGNATYSENLAQRERQIRWPNEIHDQGAREHMRAFVISAFSPPFMIERVEYMDQDGQGLFDSPHFIRKWEAELPDDVREILERQ